MIQDINELRSAVYNSLVEKSSEANEKYKPKLVLNKDNETRVGATLNKELAGCEEFYFSVAFINEAGIQYLLETLNQLNDIGVKGKILTSTYLNFNAPKAFRRLLQIPNVEVRITNKENFHAKGYIFKSKDIYSMIIGSSNLTSSALSKNTEWNLKFVSTYNGELIEQTLNEFNSEWEDSIELTKEWIDEYSEYYVKDKMINRGFKASNRVLMPNSMQEEALASLSNYRAKQDKALVISATGTGKTYLAAFDARNFRDQLNRKISVLFIAHRERLLNGARESYSNVFNDKSIKMEIFNANNKNYDADFLFASVHTLAKDEYLRRFNKDHFDYIVFDEAHHCGANSYKRILDYFKPIFTLGMTATPERTDGINIYDLFDNNVAYEIRLQRALQEDMLCPFHYYGIEDLDIGGNDLEYNDFNNIVTEERVNHIIEKSNYYGYSGERVKGLIFVSRNDFAQELEKALNNKGLKTKAISGINNEIERERYIESLESDNPDSIDYIISVDILSEGVDIPCVNQIIMLRPTQSVIVFVQQLGRGLRKFGNKDYLVVLDFIGNYTNNYLIPVALSGDKTYNKDNLRKFIREKDVMLAPGSTVSFTKIIENRIYDSINSARFSNLAFLKEKYINLKYRLGKIPSLVDFYKQGDLDPEIILNYSKSYYEFLRKVENEYDVTLSNSEIMLIEQVSRFLSNGKRVHELVIIKALIQRENINYSIVENILSKIFSISGDNESIKGAIINLTGDFYSGSDKKKYCDYKFVNVSETEIFRTDIFSEALKNSDFVSLLKDVMTYSLLKYKNEYSNERLESNLCLYKKYTRRDVCRILNWPSDETSTIYGYQVKFNTCPIFVTYEKSEDISASTKYEDKFINQNIFSWMTRSKRTLTSEEVVKIVKSQENGIKIHMFVKKGDSEGRDFYYLGEVDPIKSDISELTMKDKNGKDVPVVNIPMKFENEVRSDIYDYLIS